MAAREEVILASTITNCQTLLNQKSKASTFVQLLKLQEPSRSHNAKPKIEISAIAMKPCMEIEIEVTEAVNQRQEEVILVRLGQAKDLTVTPEKSIQAMVLPEATISAETQMVNLLSGAIPQTLERDLTSATHFQETKEHAHG